MSGDAALLSAFAGICGGGGVLAGDAVSEQYTRDWTGAAAGRALAVVLPATTAQVSAVLRICFERHIGVVPQGGHTGMCGGATPDNSGRQIVLATARLNKIRALDEAGRTMTAEAGCVLADLQDAAAARALFFPLNLGAKGGCQIGGNLATNAGGLNVLRYGSARDLCLGIEAVLADGRVLNLLSSLRKDNSGYDLKNLLIGSEGTLAVITAATLRLFAPRPPVLTAWARLPDIAAALTLLNKLQAASGDGVTAFELLPGALLDLLRRYCPDIPLPFAPAAAGLTALFELAAPAAADDALAACAAAADGVADDVVVARGEKQRADFWRARENAPAAKAKHGRWTRADISLPPAALADFAGEMRRALPAICAGLYITEFGHAGDGNLHISLRAKDQDPRQNPQASEKLLAAVYAAAAARGGSISAEHGIGAAKTALLRQYKDANALAMMRQIKRLFDPRGILNPGKVLPPPADFG